MPPPKPRQIKRPRLSLSCIVCRRRKVRCGREHPQCANCVRMKENCVYENLVRDTCTGRVRQVSPPVPQGDKSNGEESSANHSEEQTGSFTWSHWMTQHSENMIDLGDEAPLPRGNVSLIAPPPQIHPTKARCDASSVPHQHLSSSILTPAPSSRQQHVDLQYPTVPSWDDAIQLPENHKASTRAGRSRTPSASQDAATAVSASTTATGASINHHYLISSDYLSVRRGARVRYIGQAFWGFVAGKESMSDDFFDCNRDASPERPLRHISSLGMFNLLRSLPTKPVSDTFLDAFFFAVWPLSPLVHSPTLRADYDRFWDWCRNSDRALPPEKVRDDPTFLCLLFAILYTGACAAPPASWTCGGLQSLRKETTIAHLKSACRTSMSLCQHLEHPTMNTLVSTLLTATFLDRHVGPMRNMVSISTTIRIAQSLGLHREGTWSSSLSPVDREIRRRAWWYIIGLDVQSSICTGLPPCCAPETLDIVSMIADTRDDDISDLSGHFSPDLVPGPSEQSIAVILAIARAETARVQSKIVSRLQTGRHLAHTELTELVTLAKKLQQKIDKLIARVPSQGIPEQGFIPSRLAKASPITHPALYKDDGTHPTVFAAWTRIMLILLKLEVAILLQKPFLPAPDSADPESCRAWTSVAHLCVSYLRMFLQLYQTPAFSPYVRFCYQYHGPLQCAFLILVYLHRFPESEDNVLARYCIEEIIDHTVSYYQVPRESPGESRADNPECDEGSSEARIPLAIQVLVDLKSRVDTQMKSANRITHKLDENKCSLFPYTLELGSRSTEKDTVNESIFPLPDSSSSSSTIHNHRNQDAPSTATAPQTPSGTRPGPTSHVSAAIYDSGLDQDVLASLTDFESWSFSLARAK
ncbi:Zn(II)2Cys6 transcription factor [Aspergillus vadensis CBS 113365]|uniref:C6 zinc finger domain protein n=1 Tax=Aspergillus vadensis (strain CBS 113365 / IMI 142717 / IBT 24658) TaxID=1448311 RepID=A0A319C6V0_ASPVC|nr:C6 zinc finger domain protein [Aspergillus vadensis CBS 113365]PYH64562.1 C6 zinc finger domain protein [Aspergillus vadensis CBS 113365]